MSIAWEGRPMRSIGTIAKYELKMQLRSPAFWILLFFGVVIALLDNFPSPANLARLKSLVNQGYVVSRLLLQPGLVLLFGSMFLVSGRIRNDRKLMVSIASLITVRAAVAFS
jgi:polyferredoxin